MATSRRPAGRPAGARGGTARMGARFAPRKSSAGLYVGLGAGGAVLVIILIAVAAGGRADTPAASNTAAAKADPVDVSGMEAEAERRCQEGYAILQAAEGEMKRNLSVDAQRALKKRLLQAKQLLEEGLNFYERANSASGHTYDVTRYNQSLKALRMKIPELAD